MRFETDIFSQFDKKWALLTAGTIDDFNMMTISWGGLGTLWNKPVATVYVRTSRYTHDYMDDNELFTISFYPESYKKMLGVMGSKSGRDMDKMNDSGITATEVSRDLRNVRLRIVHTAVVVRLISSRKIIACHFLILLDNIGSCCYTVLVRCCSGL